MSIRSEMLAMSIVARPKIIDLAKRGVLIEMCFKEFAAKVYPGAGPDQMREMRTCFFAGAAEYYAMLLYGSGLSDTAEDHPDDMALMSGVADELDKFHGNTVDAANALPGLGGKSN